MIGKTKIRTMLLVTILCIVSLLKVSSADSWKPDLEKMRSEAKVKCSSADYVDRIEKIFCEGKIKVGIRKDYKGFADFSKNNRSGYDIDVARLVAESLGVEIDFINVTPANRISSLSSGETDLVIATMGHTSRRDQNARFIRPHYFSSQTIIVGPRQIKISTWEDMTSKTICTTVGNYANSILVPQVARVMLFDTPSRLISNLKSGACTFIAQDDSLLIPTLNASKLSALFDTKLGFAQIPWGMAVSQEGSSQLAGVLEVLSVKLHQEGKLLKLAEANHIATGYLKKMQRLWSQKNCLSAPSTCVLDPLNLSLEDGPFKGLIETVFDWVNSNLNVFYSKVSWGLFTNGAVISVVAVAGALFATAMICFLFAISLNSKNFILKSILGIFLAVFQSSPLILILVLVATIATSLFNYSQFVALSVAIISIGLVSGSFGGQALAEAWWSVGDAALPTEKINIDRWRKSVIIAAPQLQGCMANATRGVSAASFVGVADLANSLNDISSFSRNASITYWVLLIFYISMVMLVVKLCKIILHRIELVDQKA